MNRMPKIDELTLLAQSDGCSVFQMKNETGDGTMTVYEVFPGVSLMYNDFHMISCDSGFHTASDLLCIDHCREGRLEYPASEDSYAYVEAGDLKFDRRLRHRGHFSFPLAHYHGITVVFQLPEASHALPKEVKDFPVNLSAIQEKFCSDPYPQVLHGVPSLDHIFSELYAVPEKIRQPYFKVKILELLLYLDALELPKSRKERPYFYKSQVEKIKAMHKLMTGHLDRHYTLEELSSCFSISLTPLKACFKSVFGSPVNTYMRSYRMNKAATYLRQDENASVAEIAGRVGYDSSSKFAAAFKDVIGRTPLEYRKSALPLPLDDQFHQPNRREFYDAKGKLD